MKRWVTCTLHTTHVTQLEAAIRVSSGCPCFDHVFGTSSVSLQANRLGAVKILTKLLSTTCKCHTALPVTVQLDIQHLKLQAVIMHKGLLTLLWRPRACAWWPTLPGNANLSLL